MWKRLLSCAMVVVVGAWCWSAQAQQQDKQQGTPSASASSSGNSAQDSTPNDIPTPDDPAPDTKADGKQKDQSVPVGGEVKNPTTGQRVKKHVKDQVTSPWCVGGHCIGGSSEADAKRDKNAQPQLPAPPRSDDPAPAEDTNAPPPTTQGESSSKDTKIDLTPPVGDSNEHPESTPDPEAGPTEFHAWNPHRAMKNVEVGDYYYKRGNYRAAISRYQEALQWKPKDAEATFKLADAYDKVGDFIDAKDNYQKYLKILPKGPRAEDANKALARLEAK